MGDNKETVYAPSVVVERLRQDLPAWRLEDGWIRRTYETHGWKSTLMVVNTVGHLAEAAFHHPDLAVSYARVEIRLMNHAAKGITDKDFGGENRGSDRLAAGSRRRRLDRHSGRSALCLYQV